MTIHEAKKKLEDALNNNCKDNGVFFAFSQSQFDENKTPLKEGEKYADIGMGGFIPRDNVDSYIAGSDKAMAEFEKDIADNNLRERYIAYELNNHEAYYTGDIESTLSALIGTYTTDEVLAVYNKERAEHSEEY